MLLLFVSMNYFVCGHWAMTTLNLLLYLFYFVNWSIISFFNYMFLWDEKREMRVALELCWKVSRMLSSLLKPKFQRYIDSPNCFFFVGNYVKIYLPQNWQQIDDFASFTFFVKEKLWFLVHSFTDSRNLYLRIKYLSIIDSKQTTKKKWYSLEWIKRFESFQMTNAEN